ncbi:MAG: hypothetical protein M1824_005924, partial [Vezdaea acicularis]
MLPLHRWLTAIVVTVPTVIAFQVTGISNGVDPTSGARPSRQELSTLQKSGAPFDLYIQALQKFEADDQSDFLSYYEIAGIHGRPYKAWDGVGGSYETGYCTHSSIIFPPWHRPYLALYEQVLSNYVSQIAETYPDSNRAQYQQAAVNFRIPYWDWAINATLPALVTEATVNINTPNGQQSVTNPLVSYIFNPLSSSDFPPEDGKIASYHKTVRYPDRNGNSQPGLINAQLQANAGSLHDRTYLLLSQQTDYAPFSNKGYTDSRGQTFDSIESIHDTIHALVGNGGHMGIVPYSAFDPVFWLHHCQIDRLFAIWQAINPDSYVTSEVTTYGTFTNAPGSTEDVNTPLTPFHSDNAGTMYTSVTAQSTRTFGYTYPEVQDWGVTPDQLANNTRAAVKQLYDPNSQFTSRSFNSRIMRRDNGPLNIVPHVRMNQDGAYREWYVNLRVDRFALGESFFIHFFVGPFDDTELAWSADPALAGSWANFAGPSSGPAATIYGQIPLTRKLTEVYNNGGIPDLEPESVT